MRSEFARPLRSIPLHHLKNKSGRVWHCRIPADEMAGAKYYAYRVDGPDDPMSGSRFDPRKGPARPVRPRGLLSARVRPRRREGAGIKRRPGAPRRARSESPVVRRGGRVPPASRLGHGDLRDARAGLHATRELRRGARAARHLRRRDRQDPVPARTRRHGRRTAAGLPARPAGPQLLGLHAPQLLRAAQRLRGGRHAGRRHSRDARDGARAARRRASRSFSTSSTTTPWKATRSARPTAIGGSTTARTTCCGTRTGRSTATTRAPATCCTRRTSPCGRWWPTACGTGCGRCASTASASTWRRSSRAGRTGPSTWTTRR